MSLSVGLVKKCPYCGASVPAAATTCSACGALMPEAATPSTSLAGAPADGQAHSALNADVLGVVKSEGKIQAIKVVRQRTGLGLKQAKDYVEALEAGRDPGPVAAAASKTGCGAAAVVLVAAVAVVLWRLVFA